MKGKFNLYYFSGFCFIIAYSIGFVIVKNISFLPCLPLGVTFITIGYTQTAKKVKRKKDNTDLKDEKYSK